MKFTDHKYARLKPFGTVKNVWSFRGPEGGVTFHASTTNGYGTTCGLEFHVASWSSFRDKESPPDHVNCEIVGGPCWHDGTSLYATENLWPIIEPLLDEGDHDGIFRILEREYERRFGERNEA